MCSCVFSHTSDPSPGCDRTCLTRDISFAVGEVTLECWLAGLDDHPRSWATVLTRGYGLTLDAVPSAPERAETTSMPHCKASADSVAVVDIHIEHGLVISSSCGVAVPLCKRIFENVLQTVFQRLQRRVGHILDVCVSREGQAAWCTYQHCDVIRGLMRGLESWFLRITLALVSPVPQAFVALPQLGYSVGVSTCQPLCFERSSTTPRAGSSSPPTCPGLPELH